MEIKLVLAFIRRDKRESVEQKLREIGVERVDISNVRGYGEYRNLFSREWTHEEARVEVLTRRHEVERIVGAITEGAHTGLPGDGVVAVLPVEHLFLIRTRAEATPAEFWPKARLGSIEELEWRSKPSNERANGNT